MRLSVQLSQHFRRLLRRHHLMWGDALLQARGLNVDSINGKLDVHREIQKHHASTDSQSSNGWVVLQSLLEITEGRMKAEAAKTSDEPIVRTAFNLDPAHHFCPHRFARVHGQYSEIRELQDSMALELNALMVDP